MPTVGSPIGWVVNRRLPRSIRAGMRLVRPQVTAHIALRPSVALERRGQSDG
jgi:hypothetical protein